MASTLYLERDLTLVPGTRTAFGLTHDFATLCNESAKQGSIFIIRDPAVRAKYTYFSPVVTVWARVWAATMLFRSIRFLRITYHL